MEEGFTSTDIAAALFEMLAGPEIPVKKEETKAPRERREAPEMPARGLRPPARGMQWVSLNAGRETGITPRDIMVLLEEALGLPVRTVGLIDIVPGQSFAQVPKQFLDVLRDGPRQIDTEAGLIDIKLVPFDRDDRGDRDLQGGDKKKKKKDKYRK